MANRYKKVYIHLVFAVKNRKALLEKEWRNDLFAYTSGLIKNKGHYPLAINGYHDHIHILFDYNLSELIPDLVREIKKATSGFIKEKNLSSFKFEWQSGYGVFSVGWKEKLQMIEYILNQEEHHTKRTFKKEYLALMKRFEIEYNDEYMFDFFED